MVHGQESIMLIGQLSELVNLTKDTIRFYENEGLMTPVERSINGYKNYTNNHVEQLKLIKHAKELGFTLNEIKSLGELLFSNKLTLTEMSTLLKAKEQEIDTKIKQLTSFKKYIHSVLEGNCEYKSQMKQLIEKTKDS